MQASENQTQSLEYESQKTAEHSPTGISVILFEDAAHQGQLVADSRHCLQQQNTPVEFIVISSQGLRLAPLSGSQQAVSAQSFEAAVQAAKFEHIAVLDAVYQFDASHWNVVNPINKPKAFRSWSYEPSQAPGSRKLLVWLYCQIIQKLLGVIKHRIAPGMLTFTKSQLTGLKLSCLDQSEPDSVSQLLSLAKSQGRIVEEHRCTSRQANIQWTKSSSVEPHLPKSKSVKRSIKRNLQFWFSQLAFPARHASIQKTPDHQKFAFSTATVLLVGVIVLLTNSAYPLFEPDETRNAQLAMNIVDSDNWTTLTLAGEPYWDKPPLLAWLTAASYKCFGVSEWATRLPSIITSLCLLAFMIIAGAKLIGLRAATVGSVALLLAWGFAFQTRYVTMDALLTLFTTATTLAIAVGVRGTGSKTFRSEWLIGAGIALGLGVLAKGPICAILTAPPLIAWLFLNRDISRDAIRAVLRLVTIPAILISAPWFMLTVALNPEFAWHFLWKHHVVRFSNAFNHQEPFWYYIPVLWLFMFPASILLPRVMYIVASAKPKYRLQRTPEHGLLAFSAIWIVGFFSISQCKLPAYILPAFPMIALLTGVIVNFEFSNPTTKRGRFDRLPKRIAIGICTLSLVAGIVSVYQFGNTEFSGLLVFSVAIAVSLFLLFQYPLKRSTSRRSSWLATSAIGIIFVFLGVTMLVPSIAKERSILRSIAAESQDRLSHPVIYFGRDSFASNLYLPTRNVHHVAEDDLEQLSLLLAKNVQSTVVASDDNIGKLKELFGDAVTFAEAPGRHTFYASVSSPERVASGVGRNQNRR